MKKFILLQLFWLLALFAAAQDSEFLKFLKSQPAIQKIEKIQGAKQFAESYLLMVRQPIDHKDTTIGFFNQRVYVDHLSKEAPVVLETEGYVASQASRAAYLSEISNLFKTNQIDVEHRYFGKSWPGKINWKYLTVENAAADHHAIVELFKKFYSGKWINTGISKGGTTAISHRAFFPEDVDVTVAYVGPINFGVEDGRHEPFIAEKPGTKEQRSKIRQLQLEVLKRRGKIFPMFQKMVEDKKYTFRIPEKKVYDYCVLEYSFAFWQFGTNPELIPGENASDTVLFKHLFSVASPDYFSLQGIEPTKSFFVQAAHELGYYGYDTKPFKGFLKIKSAKNYLRKIFLPRGLHIKFDNTAMLKVQDFLNTTGKDMIFIYGEFDPWSASGVNIPVKPNLLKVVNPGGSHRSRIGSLPEPLKKEVLAKLSLWLESSEK
jgi:hypothetical protein